MPVDPLEIEQGQRILEDVEEVSTPPVPLGQKPKEPEMGFREGFSLGVQNEWLYPSLMDSVKDSDYAPDPTWVNPVLEDQDVPLGYRTNLARAASQEHYDAIKAQIEEEMEVHKRLQGASGYGLAGYFMSTMIDPALLVAFPFEELAIGSKVARLGKVAQVVKTGGVLGLSNAVQEGVLVTQKETRGIEDIIAAGGAGFLLGSAAKGLQIKASSVKEQRLLEDFLGTLEEADEVAATPLAKTTDAELDAKYARLDEIDDEMAILAESKDTSGRFEQLSAEHGELSKSIDADVKAALEYDELDGKAIPLTKDVLDERSTAEAFRHNKALQAEADERMAANMKAGGPSMTELSMGERTRKNINGVVSAIADRLLEHPVGTGGKKVRKSTADVRATLFEKMLGSSYADFDNYYKQWYTKQGKSWYNARIEGKGREDFGRAIMMELEARRMGKNIGSDPIVKKVADDLVPKFNALSLDIQRKAGVLGADAVPDNPHYFSRQWNFEKMFNVGKDNVIELIGRAFKRTHPQASERDARKIGRAFWNRFHDKYTQNTGANSHMFNTDTRDTFEDFLNDIVDEPTVIRIMDRIEPTRGREKAPSQFNRKLDLDMFTQLDDGTSIFDLIENDFGLILSRQTRDVSGRSAMAEVGIRSDQDWEQLIRLAREQVAKHPEISRATDEGIKDLEVARRALLGQSTIPNPNSRIARTARDLRDLTFLSRMGQMGLAQATELSNLVAEQGITSIVKSIPQLRRINKMVRNGTMPKALSDDLAALGWRVGDEHLMNLPYYRVDDGGLKVSSFGDTPFTAKWRNGLVEGKRLLGYVSLQNGIMRKEQQLWKQSTLVRFFDDAHGTNKISQARLNDMGFSKKFMNRLRGEIKKHGGKFEDQGIVSLGMDKWDKKILDQFRTGLIRQNSQAIQQNMVGDMPRWAMNSSFGQLVVQFRSFPLVAWAKQTKRQARYMDSTTFGAMAYAVPICAAIHMAKTHINSLGLSDKERKKMLDAQLSEKGMALGVARYMPVASLAPDAAAAFAPFIGMDFSSPYRSGTSRAADTSIGSLAPALGFIDSGVKGVKALVNPSNEVSPKDVRLLLGTVPFANVIGVKNMVNAISTLAE